MVKNADGENAGETGYGKNTRKMWKGSKGTAGRGKNVGRGEKSW